MEKIIGFVAHRFSLALARLFLSYPLSALRRHNDDKQIEWPQLVAGPEDGQQVPGPTFCSSTLTIRLVCK
jgi:hypothetical protein